MPRKGTDIKMSDFLILMFLFFIGCTLGWVMELFFRRFTKSNTSRKWMNPGFLVGPYLPIYGFGLCSLYLLAGLERFDVFENPVVNKIVLFAMMAVAMTLIEYIAGVIFIKIMKVKLWDYSNEKFNFQGIICLKFSIFWSLLGAVYYFFIHPYILNALEWFSNHLSFSFVLGMFFGVFMIDVVYSFRLLTKIRAFAKEHEILIKYETLKQQIQTYNKKERHKFLFAMRSKKPLREHLSEYIENLKLKK